MSGCAEPNTEDLRQYVAAVKASSSGKELEPLPEVEPYVPFEYTAEGLKDPFALSEFVKVSEISDVGPVDDGKIRPDSDRPREELEKYALGSLQMVGTYQNVAQGGELWALIKAPDAIIHRIQQGNYMGTNHGKVENITEQRIDLREIVPNSKTGGWEERDAFLTLAE